MKGRRFRLLNLESLRIAHQHWRGVALESFHGALDSWIPFQASAQNRFHVLDQRAPPLTPLWDMLFHQHDGLYSIYVHSHPLYKDNFAEISVFHGRRIPSKVQIEGRYWMPGWDFAVPLGFFLFCVFLPFRCIRLCSKLDMFTVEMDTRWIIYAYTT
ncbi:hypothetical protein Dimus_012948 [Dionaea muscipula]